MTFNINMNEEYRQFLNFLDYRDEFLEYRDIYIVKIFRLSGFWSMEWNWQFCNRLFHHKLKRLVLNGDGRNQTTRYWGKGSWLWRENNIYNTVWNFCTISTPATRNYLLVFQLHRFSRFWNFQLRFSLQKSNQSLWIDRIIDKWVI